MYQRIKDHPSNKDSPTEQIEKEHAVSMAFLQYLALTGMFAAWKEEREEYEILMVRSGLDLGLSQSLMKFTEKRPNSSLVSI